MKTADLTLEDQLLKAGVNKFSCNVASCKGIILEAMKTYTTQQTADLTAQLEKERKDKEAMGELLKEHYDLHRGLARVHTNTPLKDNHTNIAEAIKSVLTNSGITI